MGIRLVSEDEATRLPNSVLRLELRDFDFPGHPCGICPIWTSVWLIWRRWQWRSSTMAMLRRRFRTASFALIISISASGLLNRLERVRLPVSGYPAHPDPPAGCGKF